MDPLTFTRHRPDSYLGSNEDSTQLLREIISNSSDEFLIGNCSEITIEYDKEKNIAKVFDNGQGIFPNVIKDGKSVLELVYGDINSSGKYDKSEDAVYKISTGAFGIGAAITCFLSHWLIATTKRDGQFETVYFEEGKFSKRKSGKCDKTEHGVSVEFNPSEEFFRDAHPNISKLKKELFNLSCVCKGLKIIFNGEEFYHPEGLEEIVKDCINNSVEIVKTHCCFEQKQSDTQIFDFCMSATSKSNCEIIPFCNYALIENGTPVSAVKSTITRCFNNWARENGIIKKKEKNLDGSSIQEGLVIAFNLVSQNIRYDSQTKVRATSTEDNPFISSVLGEQLEVWLDSNPEDAKAILEKAILARKAAEAAKRARAAVKNNKKRGNKVKILNPDKLKDAEFLGQDSTLLVVEGLSAGASMCVAREIDKYGILMLRGKLINALANKDDRLLKNEEIQLLFKALGIRPYEDYEETSLRYGRIGICVDSDSDGFHIGLLIASALEHFCPKFIRENRLCWLRSPLYIVKYKDKEQYYFTEQEMNAARPNLPAGVEVQRCKGLGSLSASQARNSMFGENQHMDVLIPTDKTKNKLVTLMGSNADGRKDFIFNKIDFSEVKE
jgi:DNA gyrase/topoisomerase IV subunit B